MCKDLQFQAPGRNVYAAAYAFNLPAQAQDKVLTQVGKCDRRGVYVYVIASGRLDWNPT